MVLFALNQHQIKKCAKSVRMSVCELEISA